MAIHPLFPTTPRPARGRPVTLCPSTTSATSTPSPRSLGKRNFCPGATEMEHSAEISRSADDEPSQLAALFYAQRPLISERTQRPSPDEGLLEEEDELVDLQELGTLSDGDLCMGRQLVNSIALTGEQGASEVIRLRTAATTPNTVAEQQRRQTIEEVQQQQWQQQRHGTESNGISADDCLGGLVDEAVVREAFLPTEAVEQFLLGMNANGPCFEDEPTMAVVTATMGEEVPSMGDQSEPKQKKPKRGSSAEESRPTAPSPSAGEVCAPPPPPIVIAPQEVDNISITLEKNQQCACRDCGKLFNSVWYLKQHAVKHSNDRPFKCRFCLKTYKFRSNLYQHKCPERSRLLMAGEFNLVGHPYRRRAYNRSSEKGQKTTVNNNNKNCDANAPFSSSSISINISPTNEDVYVPNMGTFVPKGETDGGPGLLMVGETNAEMGQQKQQQLDDNNNAQQQQQHFLGLNGGGEFGPIASRVLSSVVVDNEPPMRNVFHSSHLYDFTASPPFGSVQFAQFGNGVDGRSCSVPSSSSSPQMAPTVGREKKLPMELIEEYMRRNRHRVFNCRKCKLYFPSREYFARHLAYHDEMEEHKYCCGKCPERFQTDVSLQAHQLQHADQSPHCCVTCNGIFRSALALRRHKDNWRQCHSPPFGIQYSLAVNPIDQYSFVESDLDEIEFGTEQSEAEDEEDGIEQGENTTAQLDEENSAGAQPNTLSRKTTRDSGYQGSDTYSPSTGTHSPYALESDDQQQQHTPITGPNTRDLHGRFVTLKNGKGQHKNSGKRKDNDGSEKTMVDGESGERRESAMDKNNNQTLRQPWAESTDASPNIFKF